ncbi:MAG TPA: hypothetical protein VFQ77_17415 [Pseudonocardiaceae bacterium]|jgi:hypothetical protein|nr:hypothetical protein [Pseudonocardiaceae bacterium]
MMLVVKTLGGWSARWIVVAAVAVGLAAVTGWMLTKGDRGVQVAAVLGFPVAVLGVLVAALGLLMVIRGNPVPPPQSPEQRSEERPESPRWSVRARIALAAGAIVTLAVTVSGVLIGVITLTDSTGEPQVPSPANTGPRDPREADPCLLIDENALRSFGTPSLATSPWLQGCEYVIDNPEGGDARLRVQFRSPDPKEPEYDERIVKIEGAPGCESRRELTAQLAVTVAAFTHSDNPVDLCAITRAATTVADNIIDQKGVPYIPGRTSNYSHASYRACDLLDNATFSNHGLDPIHRNTGFGNWTCYWTMADNTVVGVLLGLGDLDYGDYGEPTTMIAGKDAFLDRGQEPCVVYVVHRSGSTATAEMFHVSVEGPLDVNQRCDLAAKLAKAVEEKLPG